MFKFDKKNRQAGMTYVELIVVLSIFAIMSSIAIFNYGDFQASIDLKNLTSDIASQIVQAQKSALNGILPTAPSVSWKPAYGVYFNSNPTVDPNDNYFFNKKFIYFTDLNNNNLYDGLPSCTPAECDNKNKIIITKGDYISGLLLVFQGGSSSNVEDLTVTFTRPNSSAVINSTPIFTEPIDHVQITVTSPKGVKSYIKIFPSGRVQVN